MDYQLKCVIWEITLKCNLRCSHCGSAAGQERMNELTTDECLKVCEELAELKCPSVTLMGGEPFLRPDWLSIAQYIKSLGMEVCFVSNGYLLENLIDKLANLNPKVVGVSLDGTEEIHDKIRGRGVYKRAVKALDLLREGNIEATAITTVSKQNFKDLPGLQKIIQKRNIGWQIQIAIPTGYFQKAAMLSKEEFYALSLYMAKQRLLYKFQELPMAGTHCFGYFSKVLPNSPWQGCPAGISSLGITSNGGVTGCLAMAVDKFAYDNIRDRSLVEIWKNPASFGYNRKFTSEQLGDNCRECAYAKECQGGCNGVSFGCTDKLHNNPYCFHSIEKNIIKL